MKRTLISLAVASGLGLASTAAMADFIFDGFGNDQGPVKDTIIDATAVTSGWLAVTDTTIAGLEREIFANKTGGSASTTLGISAVVTDGGFLSSQDAGVTTGGVTGSSGASYRIAGGGIANLTGWEALSLQIKVIFADLAGGKVSFELVDADGDKLSTSFDIAAGPGTYSRAFSAFTATGGSFDWSKYKSGSLTVDGTAVPALDISIDIIKSVPEPATLALLGLGLAGLGFAGRRRQK